jgi:hypothetical protein
LAFAIPLPKSPSAFSGSGSQVSSSIFRKRVVSRISPFR